MDYLFSSAFVTGLSIFATASAAAYPIHWVVCHSHWAKRRADTFCQQYNVTETNFNQVLDNNKKALVDIYIMIAAYEYSALVPALITTGMFSRSVTVCGNVILMHLLLRIVSLNLAKIHVAFASSEFAWRAPITAGLAAAIAVLLG